MKISNLEENPILKTIFIGIGNEFRNDDGVGIYIVRRLAKRNFPKVNILELSGEGSELLEAWKEAEQVYIFDAVSSGAEPGTIFELNVHEEEIPSKFFSYSTHNFSLAEAVELSRVLNRLPATLRIFGIEGKDFLGRQRIIC
ncbi:MAG: hydrogenase maturation protease [Calditrichae bacterium]|nr:hydrogenase maturation protease [Calditrichia bacterium]